MVWWFIFSRTTQKSGDFSVQSAAAIVTAKIKKTRKIIMLYINSRVLNGGEFKNEFIFSFRIPSDPNKGVAGGALGGEGGLRPIHDKR